MIQDVKPYISSMVSRYGDIENVKRDVKMLNEIIDRQGDNLLFDVIAEHIGNVALKYKINSSEILNLTANLIKDFEKSIKERI